MIPFLRIAPTITCDIFCRVVDNFGDIGVTWRLARQLSSEFALQVRLIVDDLVCFQKLAFEVDVNADSQCLSGITILHWHKNLHLEPAQCVIEAFQCAPPTSYINAMAAMTPSPVWLNLEYLSAEGWIGEHHLLPSPHPKTGLNKFFFFPGFRANTGGLIREQSLLLQQQQFQLQLEGELELGHQHEHEYQYQYQYERKRVDEPATADVRPLKIFMFGYENAALPALFKSITQSRSRTICTIPDGALARQAKALKMEAKGKVEEEEEMKLQVQTIKFQQQPEFDRLLWPQDVLFVRGEDSFVRAQWAAKPFIWQIYPQAERAHWLKLNAFLDLYCAELASDAAAALRELHRVWNDEDIDAAGSAWSAFMRQLGPLRKHAVLWAQKLSQMPDLATQLMTFYAKTARI